MWISRLPWPRTPRSLRLSAAVALFAAAAVVPGGRRPTTRTADPLVDAYLWISRPGFSSGPCNGGPPAGSWWPERALLLARRAKY